MFVVTMQNTITVVIIYLYSIGTLTYGSKNDKNVNSMFVNDVH